MKPPKPFADVYKPHETYSGYVSWISIPISSISGNVDRRVVKIRKFCKLQDESGVLSRVEASEFDVAAMSQMNLSARAYHRIMKLARTIADLAWSEGIQSPHLAEEGNLDIR